MISTILDFRWRRLLPSLIAVAAVIHAYSISWSCDDAFISYRYALNLFRGNGLVYNTGEYVEGYTNFLFTLLLSLSFFTNITPEALSRWIGLASYTVILLLLYKFSGFIRGKKGDFFPVAMVLYAFMEHGRIWATGGLETSFFTALLLAGYYFLLSGKVRPSLFVMALVSLTRPEGFLYSLFLILYVAFSGIFNKNRISTGKETGSGIAVYGIMVVPYLLWKIYYYGSLLPNTYYAKADTMNRWMQGLEFVLLFLNSYYVFYVIAFLIVFFAVKNRHTFDHTDFSRLLLLIPFILHAIQIVVSGGGFMFARQMLPMVPFLLLGLEYLLVRSVRGNRKSAVVITLSLLMVFRYDPYRNRDLPILHGISEENQIYTLASLTHIRTIAVKYREFVKRFNVRIAIGGGGASFAYYLDAPYVMETSAGLTDPVIARMPAHPNSRPGHGKMVPVSYMREKHIHFHLNSSELPEDNHSLRVRVDELAPLWRVIHREPWMDNEFMKLDGITLIRSHDGEETP